MKFTIALAQSDSIPGDLRKNLDAHVRSIVRAREGGADLVVFPELSLTGYTVMDAAWELSVPRGRGSWFRELQESCTGISAIVGGIEESSGYGLFNAAYLVTRDEVATVHRKVYPPTYGMFEEKRYFLGGRGVAAFDIPFARLGVLICEDLWHLPLPYLLAQDGAEVIVGLAASPTRLSGNDPELRSESVNGEQHRALARLLSVYVCFCNRVGYEDGVNFWGGSSVIAPTGDVVAKAGLFKEEMLFAEIDSDAIRRARRTSRHFLDEDPHLTLRELERIVGKRTEG